METFVTIRDVGCKQLARTIDVKGCDVAVTRLILPIRYYTFDDCIIKVRLSEETRDIKFPGGHYPTGDILVDMLERLIGGDSDTIEFAYERETMHAYIDIKNSRHYIDLPRQLATALKMPNRIRGFVDSTGPMDTIKPLFLLEGDFVKPQLYNGTSRKILYVAHETHCREYVKSPVFLPVSRDSIDSLTLWLRDENGKNIRFMEGRVLVQLCFRHKY